MSQYVLLATSAVAALLGAPTRAGNEVEIPPLAANEPASALDASAPRAWFGRQTVGLNGRWEALDRPWSATEDDPPRPDEAWRPVSVPGYLLAPGRSGQSAWVRRTFALPADFEFPRIVLHFERVHTRCAVYLNGTRIGERLCDGLPFEFDVGGAVRRDGPNELLLLVRNWLSSYEPPIDPALTFPDAVAFARAHPEHRLTHSAHEDGDLPGIPCDVLLIGTGRAFVDDVAVRSRLDPTALAVAGTVRGGGAGRLTAACDVLEDGRSVLALPDAPVEGGAFAAGGKFPGGAPWRPGKPKLYELRTRLRDEQGAVVDEHLERFGIRTVEAAGGVMRFNGVPMRFRNSGSGWPACGRFDPCSRVEMVKGFERMRTVNVWTQRTRDPVHPRLMFQAADEAGVLLIAEPPAPLPHLFDRPDYYPNFYERWIRLIRNSPSVLMVSAMNEFFGESPERYDRFRGPVTDIVRRMKALAPGLPLTFGGDRDVYGLADVLGLLDPDACPWQSRWPDDLYWTGGPKRGDAPAHASGRFRWDRKKPLHIDEIGRMDPDTPDPDAAFLGDAAYHEPFGTAGGLHDVTRALAWFGTIEAYRNQGVTGIGVSTLCGNGEAADSRPLVMAVRQAYAPVVAFPRDYFAHGFAGGEAERRLVLHNDLLERAEIEVRWAHQVAPEWRVPDGADAAAFARAEAWRSFTTLEDEADGALRWEAAAEGTLRQRLEPAQIANVRVRVPLPAAERRLRGRLRLEVRRNGAVVWVGCRGLDVWPAPAPVETARRLMLLGGDGKARDALAAAGCAPRGADSIAGALSAVDGGILVLGDGATRAAAAARLPLADWVAAGGRAICLEQETWTEWLPFDWPKPEEASHSIAHVRAPGHPLLAGFSTTDFRFWAPDHRVARRMFRKPAAGSFRPLIDLGTPEGLTHTALAEVPWGRGLYLLCSLALTDRAGVEPVASALLREMVRYADGYQARPREVLALPCDSGPVRETWAAGANPRTVAAGELAGVLQADPAAKLLLISHPSDGWASLAPLAGDIRRAVEQGLTLYLHNVNARGLPFARRVLPEAGLKPVQSAPDEPVRIVRNGPLTWGISSQQLHWYDRAPTSGVRPLLPFPGLGFTAGVPHEAYVSDGRLLRVPLGEGWVVIDQVPWHDAPGNEEEARRYASILLTNLRVASGESPAPSAQ